MHNATAADLGRLGEAVMAFATADLELPSLDIWFHTDRRPCDEYYGAFRATPESWQILICSPDIKTVYEHELAHAWVTANVTDTQRSAFMNLRGLEHWADRDVPWNQRGTEWAAVIIQQGLSGLPLPPALSNEARSRASGCVSRRRVLCRPPSSTTFRSRLRLRGTVFVDGVDMEHGAAVGEGGEAVGIWLDAMYPLEELCAVGYLDGEGSKHGFTLIRGKLSDSHLPLLLAICQVTPAGGAHIADPVGVFQPAHGVVDTVEGEKRDGSSPHLTGGPPWDGQNVDGAGLEPAAL